MERRTLLHILFIAAFLFSIVGAALKLNFVTGADFMMMIGIVSHFLFVGVAIYEIAGSNRIGRSDKLLWYFALIAIGGVAGVYYLLVGRKKVLAV